MHRNARLLLTAAAVLATALPAGTATAATSGRVLVFSTEVEPVQTYEAPSGCTKAPPTAHVLINETDGPVRVHGDPFCLSPSLVVPPGHGAHVPPGTGSFSA
ncbi:hypothetical protein [Saccharopolyspora gregorii]|uniref:Secreted protein n=1 Tax=Saccharopolyspora gregorii TaxID=33914 RepID=A0ABP6RQM9_9PSEU|nr:hypothetical protein [Saccharopolyspora gregorii]